MLSFNLVLAALLLAVSKTQVLAQSCACGYQDSNGHVWREAIVSTFTQDAGALTAVDADWVIATDLETQPTGDKSIQYVSANVMEYQDALGLKASAYSGSGAVHCAEIFTQRSDILYGSFRMQAQVPDVPGVVFGFFTYISDTQEQDIEFLSSDSDYYQQVHYTNQPGQLPNGNPDTNAAKDVEVPGADFTYEPFTESRSKLTVQYCRTFGVHRFDWLQSETIYSYAGNADDGAPITSTTTITEHVPTTASEFILNVWSNGDPGWSKGPPMADAIATVQYVHLYFNSTSFSPASFNSACSAAGHISPCAV
ncbi:concanavalin A-like lectin/glucanase domain-containing protein [Mycena epipterygia]|nr:concanavalin A-like lectin/glucanase domain-containing protein [Mycena epipterygia]